MTWPVPETIDDGPGQRGVEVRRVDASHLVPSLRDGSRPGEAARLADLFGSREDGRLVLRAVLAADTEGRYVIIEWDVDGDEYPAISEAWPAAFVEECEIYEQFGARPAGGKSLNRVLVPPHAEREFPRLGEPPRRDPSTVRARYFVAGEAFEFPVGPVRGVGQESLYMGLVTTGEEVLDLYLHQWHKHRGIERRVQGMELDRGLFFVERAEGLSAVANGWAYCRAAEAATRCRPTPGVERTRVVALELERIYNHTAAIAALCQATGLSVGQAQAEMALEDLLRLNLAAAGHRYLFGLLCVGGVTRPVDSRAIRALLPPAVDGLRRVVGALTTTNSFLDRLESAGIVPEDTAGRLGLVGPVARASGQAIDCRTDHFVPHYKDHGLQVPVRRGGDVLSRMQVMVDEVEESTRIVGEMVRGELESGACACSSGSGSGGSSGGSGGSGSGSGAASALGWCESPRGESLVWLAIDGAGQIARARLRPASVRNWRAFDDAARSRNVFTDIPIIEASFWLTVAGFAR